MSRKSVDSLNEDLWEAYRSTTYWARPTDGPPWPVRIGEVAPCPGPMAWITADNPGSQRLKNGQNRRRRRQLREVLVARDLQFWPGRAVDDEHQWPVEKGFWIAGISRDEARHLGRQFDQYAILYVDAGATVHLLACQPSQDMSKPDSLYR